MQYDELKKRIRKPASSGGAALAAMRLVVAMVCVELALSVAMVAL